jgi:Fe-coproporphyrin III synthase
MEDNQKIWSFFEEAVIAVTYRCNLRCQMCNIWQRNDLFELPKEQYLKLPENLKEINITGGEPFLRNDLVEVIKQIHQACPQAHLSFSTNGYATEIIFQRIREISKITDNFSVSVSLDGIENKHNQIRGREASFNNALITLNKLKSLGFDSSRLKIAFTLNDDNYDQLEKVYQLSRDLKVDFTLAAVHNAENYFAIDSNQLSRRTEIKAALEKLVNQELKSTSVKKWFRAYFAYGLWNFIATGQRLLADYGGQKYFFLDPLGNIFASNVSNNILGNLKDLDKADFGKTTKNDVQSWMICTVRPSMKVHLLRVSWWVIKSKIKGNVKL